MPTDGTPGIHSQPLINTLGVETVPTGPESCGRCDGFLANRTVGICNSHPGLCSVCDLVSCRNDGDRIKEIPQDIAREVNVHDEGLGLRRPIHKHAENLERNRRVPELGRNNVVACLSLQESHGAVKDTFGLKDFTEHIQDTVFVFEVTHV
jgi:hypothetical protein